MQHWNSAFRMVWS
jgi:hypothetical protein